MHCFNSVAQAAFLVFYAILLPSEANAKLYPPEFQQLMSIVPGVYDNKAQYENDIARGLPPDQVHHHVTTSLQLEYVPFLAERKNFYLEQYEAGDSSHPYRQRLYSFGVDRITQNIELKFYKLNNPSRFLHAEVNDPLFSFLTPSDVEYVEHCDMYWYQIDAQPVRFGSWMLRSCFVTYDGQKVLITDNNMWTQSYLTIFEHMITAEGTDLSKLTTPYNLTQVPDVDWLPHFFSGNQRSPPRRQQPHDFWARIFGRMIGR